MLFNRPIQGLLHQINRESINVDNDVSHYKAPKAHPKCYKDIDTQKSCFFSAEITVDIKWEEGGHGCTEK